MKTRLTPEDKMDLMMAITLAIRDRFDAVAKEAQIQPFAGSRSGPCKIVTLDAVGYELVEGVLHDLTDAVRKM